MRRLTVSTPDTLHRDAALAVMALAAVAVTVLLSVAVASVGRPLHTNCVTTYTFCQVHKIMCTVLVLVTKHHS
jgi:hypothetical protein